MKYKTIMMARVFWCFLACLLTGMVAAQDATVSVRTMQLGGDALPESWVMVKGEKEPVIVDWLTSQPSQPLNVIHDGQLRLLRYSTNAAGERTLEVAKLIKLPVGANEVLLLAWMSDGQERYVVIKDHFLKAKFNDWLVINTSSNPVALLAGEKAKPLRLDAGKSAVFQPNIQEGKGVKILAQAQRNEEVRTFLSSYWPAFPGQRTMIIFYDDGEKMRARRIGDRFLPKKKEEE